MKRRIVTGFAIAALCASAGIAFGQAASAGDNLPMVPPAKPGVFTAQKKGAAGYHLVRHRELDCRARH